MLAIKSEAAVFEFLLVSEITYHVSSGTLNRTIPLYRLTHWCGGLVVKWVPHYSVNKCISVIEDHCWLGHLTCKIVSEVTYHVSSGTLNLTIPFECVHVSKVCYLPYLTTSSAVTERPHNVLNNGVPVKSWLEVIQDHWKWHCSIGSVHLPDSWQVSAEFESLPLTSTWWYLTFDVGLRDGRGILAELSLCYSIMYWFKGTSSFYGSLDWIRLWSSLV